VGDLLSQEGCRKVTAYFNTTQRAGLAATYMMNWVSWLSLEQYITIVWPDIVVNANWGKH